MLASSDTRRRSPATDATVRTSIVARSTTNDCNVRLNTRAAKTPVAIPTAASKGPLAHHRHEDPAARRPERQPDAKLTSALRDRVGNQPVDPGRCEQEAN